MLSGIIQQMPSFRELPTADISAAWEKVIEIDDLILEKREDNNSDYRERQLVEWADSPPTNLAVYLCRVDDAEPAKAAE
jgi:hypothetical protein